MKKIPIDQHIDIINEQTGRAKTIVLHSYVVTLTAKGGSTVMAVRIDSQPNKQDVGRAIRQSCGALWNIKNIARLYDKDFEP